LVRQTPRAFRRNIDKAQLMFPATSQYCVPTPWRSRLKLTIASLCTLAFFGLAVSPAWAQLEIVSRDLYQERPRNEGNRVAFCLRPVGPLADFEAELADKIGSMLLTQVRTYTLGIRNFPVRPSIYDYIFGLTEDQMFIMMAQNCDVVLGMHLTAGSATWLRLSRPYIVAEMLAVSRDPAITDIGQLNATHRIGTQAMAAGDGGLVSLLKTLPEGEAPERVIFRSNEALFKALDEGTIHAALIWEGAVMAGTEGKADRFSRMGKLPFPTDKILVSAAVRVEDALLGALIDEAIGALEENGTLGEMALRHHILWDDAR